MADSNDTRKDSLKGRLSRHWRAIVIGMVIMLAGAVTAAAIGVGLDATNEMGFCISCHTMTVNYDEYRVTSHYRSRTGVRATCADCHVPKELGPKLFAKVIAVKDLYHEIVGTIDTPEKYEAHRWRMATAVWDKMRANDSRECRTCHQFEHMDLSEQGRTARRKHGRAMEDGGKTCIDCHQGIAHELPDEPEEPEEKAY